MGTAALSSVSLRAVLRRIGGPSRWLFDLDKERPMDLRLLFSTFGLLFLAELGDKTQLAVFTLVARHKAPIPIFLGAAIALVLVTALGALVGQGVAQVVPEDVIHRSAAALFILMGILIWFDVL
jgi:putative Ca2+/H+ antiporter (TMEM165/GDT1 family)